MRSRFRIVVFLLILMNSLGMPFSQALAAELDPSADRVFGQPDFTSNLNNNGGLSASSLYIATGVAVDAQGNLYVADLFNHRVLEYDTPATTDAVADRVFGQPDFTSNIPNNGGVSVKQPSLSLRQSRWMPRGTCTWPINPTAACRIPCPPDNRRRRRPRSFGQPDFTSNNSEVGPRKLDHPTLGSARWAGEFVRGRPIQ